MMSNPLSPSRSTTGPTEKGTWSIPKMTPPRHLSKETLIVWEGWRKMGPREVVRESAAKGSHVDLAYTFLQQYKQVSLECVKSWFKEEVIAWAVELLQNKQIFRVSHILKNINLDPFSEITNIMLNTVDTDNMNFLASHLEKNGQLNEDYMLNIRLLNIIKNDIDTIESFKQILPAWSKGEITLKMLLNCDIKWKAVVVAKLFLKYYDFSLTPLLSASVLWSYVLESNDKAFLKIWLEIQNTPVEEHAKEDQLAAVLYDLKISENMYSDVIERHDIQRETKEFVYDTLAKYGKFNSEEVKDIKKILNRTSRNMLNDSLEAVLAQPSSNLTYKVFKQQLRDYCLKNDLYIILDACQQDEDYLFIDNDDLQSDETLNLLKSCKEVARNPNNNHVLTVNLNMINQFIQQSTQESQNEQNDKFKTLLHIVLLYFQGDDIQKFLIQAPTFQDYLPTIKVMLGKFMTNLPSSGVTRYDLLEKHLTISVKDLFSFQFDKNITDRPNFKSQELVQQYGQHKTLDYASFLLHCRPGKALKLVGNGNINVIERKVRRLVIKNFLRDDIAAACVYFLDCLGVQTNELKIELCAAKLIHKRRQFDQGEVKNLFLSGKTYEVVKIYEEILFPTKNEEFTDNFIQLEYIIKLAVHYGCQLPELYLEQLANESKWIEFIFIIHKFEYPQEQVNKLVSNFTNQALYDHISHALSHDLVFESKNILMRDTDARKFFLARIGLLKHMESDIMSSVTSQSSWGSNTSSSGLSDYISDIECSDENRPDLLQVLIRCHNSNDPPKALLHACQFYKYPLLAVLATTYEPDSVVTCWLTWLSVSCGVEVESCERLATIGSLVTDFLQKIAEMRFYKTLRQSMTVFLSDNPLKDFLDFLVECHNSDFDSQELHKHQENLKSFQRKLNMKRSNSYVPEIDHEMLYLNNKLWTETTAITLLASSLHNQNKPYQRVQFLKVLMDLDLQKYFIVTLPNITNLYNHFNYFYDLQITTKLDFHKLFDINQNENEIKTCILTLLGDGKYEEALKIAQIEMILIDEILMKKWAQTYEGQQESEHYWACCDEEFQRYSISAENAVLFYMERKVNDEVLRHKILSLAYIWCQKFGLKKQQEVELEMWLCYLKQIELNIQIAIDQKTEKSYLEMKTDLEQITLQYTNQLTEKETEKLDAVIDKILKAGAIFQAFRLQKLFIHYQNVNLDIFRLCYALAEGLTLPIQLTAQERLLLRKVKNNRTYSHRRKPLFSFRHSNSASRSPASTFGPLMDVEPKVQDTLCLIESLTEGLTCGFELGERILMTHRISINTEVSYNNILSIEEPSILLLNAMKSDCPNKIEVAHDFFCVYNWNKEQIADFLCEQLITAVNASVKAKLGSNTMWDINLDQEIHLILQLLSDSCSKLGIKLYSYSSALHKAITVTNEMTNLFELSVVIELLILSHECYTYDCNMEGISIILKKCQTLINLLLALKNWALIVRLLTGVGRYNELNYVFHILRDNDQFEFLLRKGSARDNGLRVALLDYLKKFCPDDRILYEMVALYFSLYSEVAQLWEGESRQSIKNLIAISKLEMINRKVNPDECIFVEFSNTEGTKICLSKVMENYSHAAEYHLQGEKLAKAMNAAQQAELIALQISLIKAVPTNATTKCILNLTSLQIAALFSTLSFQQALIVTEAFNYQADWAHILFEHFIVQNDIKYFDNYLMTFNITDNLVHNLSRHYLAKNVTTAHGAKNMKLMLMLLPSIHTQYRIASELGFADLVESLLNSDKLNYLKDTVWKRGYRE